MPPPAGTSGDPTFDAAAHEAPAPSLGYRSAALAAPPGASDDLPPGLRSGDEKAAAKKKAKTRGRLGRVAVAVVLLAAIAGTVALTQLTKSDDEVLADMEVGECFEGDPTDSMSIVDCLEPHLGELYAVVPAPEDLGDEFPHPNDLEDAADEACGDELEGYTGVDHERLEEEDYGVLTFRPRENDWNEDRRDIYCTLGRLDGQEHAVPLKDLGDTLEDEEAEEDGDEADTEEEG